MRMFSMCICVCLDNDEFSMCMFSMCICVCLDNDENVFHVYLCVFRQR